MTTTAQNMAQGPAGQTATMGDPRLDASTRLGAMPVAQRLDMASHARRLLDEAGLSFNPFHDSGDDRSGWRFDPAPLILTGDTWSMLTAGAIQRAEMIDAALGDLYGPQSLIREGVLPPSMLAAPEFIRSAARWPVEPRWRLFLYSVDVAQQTDVTWVVLDDHVDRPEGMGWALANRVALSQAASEFFVEVSPRRLGGFFSTLQEELEAGAGPEERVTLLTAGSDDPAYFSHAYMARYLDLTLVEPGDLTARNGEAHVKTLEGLRRMGVALRGVPSLGIDPVYAPGPSAVAPPGVLYAAKHGVTKFANMVGAGVFDGRALAPWSQSLMRRLIGEDPILPEAPWLDLGDAGGRETYLANPGAWRLTRARAATRPGGLTERTIFDGLEGDALARKLAREGWRFGARGKIDLATAPAFDAGGGKADLTDRGFAIRLFIVRGPNGFECLPGGLAQTSPEPSADAMPWRGASKDVWVVGDDTPTEPAAVTVLAQRRSSAHRRRTGRDLLSRVADNLFWLGRFGERAETTLRILKLVLERFIEAPRRQREPDMLADLLEIHLGAGGVKAPRDERALINAMADLAFDASKVFGLRQSLDGVHRNAAQTRAHLSRDGWRDVAALCNSPTWRGRPADARPLTLARPIEEGIRALTAFSGAQHENMTRNFAWAFLDLGRRIERGVQTAGMLRAMMTEPREDEPTALLTLLQLCDSFFAYRSRYMTTPDPAAVLDLIGLDEINPRSLAFQLAAIERGIGSLPNPSHMRTPEHKMALSLLTDFRVMDAPTLASVEEDGDMLRRAVLDRALDRAETGLEQISDGLAAAYFAHAEAPPRAIALARLEGRDAL